METHESISPDEASEALAAAERSRARVAWSGYPAWYWLATGSGLGALTYGILQYGWWSWAIPPAVALILVVAARVASRSRGINEGCARKAMTFRDQVILGGPVALVILATAIASKFTSLASWSPIVAAVLVFALYASTGLTRSARVARP